MSWIVAGSSPSLNITTGIEQTLITFLKANWTLTVPPVNDIQFGQDWYDERDDFQIHANYVSTVIGSKAVGYPAYTQYITRIDLHIFVKMLSEDLSFVQLNNIEQEVDRILNTQGAAIAPGLVIWGLGAVRDIPDPTNERSLWHRVFSTSISYWKTKA